jgi:hypothetical protein
LAFGLPFWMNTSELVNLQSILSLKIDKLWTGTFFGLSWRGAGHCESSCPWGIWLCVSWQADFYICCFGRLFHTLCSCDHWFCMSIGSRPCRILLCITMRMLCLYMLCLCVYACKCVEYRISFLLSREFNFSTQL